MKKLLFIALLLLSGTTLAESRVAMSRGTVEEFPSKHPLVECVRGNVPGCTPLIKYAANAAVGTTEEDIWDQGGTYLGYPTSPVTIRCDSDDVNDASGGTGATLVNAVGIDSNWDWREEMYVPTGTTAVVLTGSWLRLFRVQVVTAGSTKANVGTLFCEDDSLGDGAVSADDYAQILPGNSSTLMAIVTIPDGKEGIFVNGAFTVGKLDDAEVSIYARSNNAAIFPDGAWLLTNRAYIYQNSWTLSDNTMGAVPARTDVRFSAKASTGTITVTGNIMIYLYDE